MYDQHKVYDQHKAYGDLIARNGFDAASYPGISRMFAEKFPHDQSVAMEREFFTMLNLMIKKNPDIELLADLKELLLQFSS